MYGYFESPDQTTPQFDPGLDVDCPICHKRLEAPVKTISLMLDGDNRSYFYRTHAACYDDLSPDERAVFDSAIIDAVAQKRNVN